MKKIIIGLTGEMASGKGTVAKRLIKKHEASVHRFSDVLRAILELLGLDITRTNMQKLSTSIRKDFGEDVLAKGVYRMVTNNNHKLVVVDGIRRSQDFTLLRELSGFKLVYVKAPIETRYKRVLKREENSDDTRKTFEGFEKDNQQEPEREIRGLEKEADIIIENNGTLEDLEAQVDALIYG